MNVDITPIQVEGIRITELQVKPEAYTTRTSRSPIQKTRLFVSIKDETAMQNFLSRMAQRAGAPPRLSPRAIRKHVLEAVVKELRKKHPEANITSPSQAHWSRWAGCSSCPCSPGYVVENSYNHTINVTVEPGSVAQAPETP